MSDLINKEKIACGLAFLLFLWGLSGFLSPADPAGRLPRGKRFDRPPRAFLSPDLRVSESDRVYREDGRDVFAEPVVLKPLKPLDLQPPPLARAPLTAPPPVPGPLPRYWQGLRHAMPPAPVGGGVPGGEAAGGEAAGASPGEAAPAPPGGEDEKEAPPVDPDRVYDSVIRKGSSTRIYGRIRNPDPLELVEMEKDGEENQFVLKNGARLEFDYYDTKTGLRRGAETFTADRLEVFSLAATDENLYAVKRRRVPDGNVAARVELGRWLASIGRVDWASREYRRALALDPRHKEIYLELGQTLEHDYLWEEALACYRLARENGVDDAALLYREGLLFKRFGMLEPAVDRFRRALEIDRGDTKARLALGECLTGLGRLEEALGELKQAHGASAPTGTPIMNALWVDASVALGRAHLKAGHFKEATRYFRAVVDEDREKAGKKALQGLGAALYAEGKPDALKEAVDVWAADGGSSISRESLIDRGYALARLGRYAEARAALETAAREDPLHADRATLGLAFVAECEGKIDEATEKYEDALVRNPTILYNHLALGRIQRRQGDYEAARAALSKVLERAPDAVDALTEMAMAALAVHQPAEALRYLEHALAIEPRSLTLLDLFGAALLRAQREQQAMDVFEKVMARRDDDPVALVNTAVVHYRRGEFLKAIGNLKAAIEAGRNDPTMKAIVEYARRTAAAIEDNAWKRVWEDDFNRTEIRNDWRPEHSHGVICRLVEGAVRFRGTQNDSAEKETALVRTVSLGELVSFDVALTVLPGTRANTGVELLVRRRSRRSRGLRGALQFARNAKGRLVYRVFEDGEFKPWQALDRVWPGPGAVRIGFERSGSPGHKWNLTIDGEVVKRDVEVRNLRGWNRDGLVGVFGSAKIGTDWGLRADDARMILRKKP